MYNLNAKQLRYLRERDFTLEQAMVFALIVEKSAEGHTQCAYCDVLAASGCTKASFSRHIHKLKRPLGWIETVTNFDDMRHKSLVMTPEGIEALQSLKAL